MTKISKKAAYPIKKPIKSDYFIGSDSEDFGRTVNFDFKDATAVINELNGQSVIGYQFRFADNILLGVLEEAEFYSLGNETTISDITKLYVNKFTKNSLNLSNLYNYLLVNSGDFLFKLQGTDPNVYVYFNLASIENHSDYYTFNVSLYKGNAVLPELINFGEYFFNFELKSTGGGVGTDIIDRIVALESQTDVDNAFITKPTFSLSANTLTIDALGKWKLEGVIYENPASVAFPITLCTAGKTRLDYFVPNNANGFTKVSGIETLGLAIAPQLPNENLYVTYVLVTDSSVGTPVTPPTVVIPTLQQVLTSGFSTTKFIWFWNTLNSKCTRFASDHILFQKLESVFNFIRSDNTTQSYTVQLPNKIGGAEQTFAMVSDLTKSQVGLSNVDNTSDATKPVSSLQQTALDLKVDKVAGKGLSTEDYTTSEKNKLASIDATHYLAPLQTTAQLSALPQASISDKARVYVENDLSDYFYDATASSGDIAPNDQIGGVGFWRKVAVGGETAASIKTKYESNADTNAFTNALKVKLDSITEIFTTALKTGYDGVVTGYTALMATGSRLITSGEITKLSNTSGTNSGDQDLSSLAPKASPALTGTPTAPTATAGTNTTQIATTAFVQENVGANTYWTKTGNNIANNNSGIVTVAGMNFGNIGGNVFAEFNRYGGDISFILGNPGFQTTDIKINNATGGVIASSSSLTLSASNASKLIVSSDRVDSLVPIKLKNYTVATLPTGVRGDTAYVTDATAPTYLGTLTGGGSVVCPVFYNGTSWVSTIDSITTSTLIETEIDFGTKPLNNKTFTITNSNIVSTNKIIVTLSPNDATGRVGNDWEVDSATFTAKANTGNLTLYANAQYSISGKRKIYYQILN